MSDGRIHAKGEPGRSVRALSRAALFHCLSDDWQRQCRGGSGAGDLSALSGERKLGDCLSERLSYHDYYPSGDGLSEIGPRRPRTVYGSLAARTSPHIGGWWVSSGRP